MKKIIIVGAGASGLVAAIKQKKNKNEVILLEKNTTCGKKILATGNGRCNYYNENQDLSNYNSDDKELIRNIINEKTNKKVIDFFTTLGIIPRIKDGYYYPYSNQAVSIQNALIEEVENLNIEIKTETTVKNIIKENNKFIVTTNKEKLVCDKVIISTGSNASLKKDDVYNGYSLVEKLGHKVIKVLPALTQLNCNYNFLKEWSGIRSDVNIKLFEDDTYKTEENGEILLTNYGLSGICVMQLSRYVAKGLDKDKKEEVIINFLPEFTKTRQEFIDFMDQRNVILENRNITELLDTILNYKLINVLVKKSGINTTKRWSQLTNKEKSILASNFVELRLEISSTNTFSKAQTVSGGVPLSEVNLNNMESKIVKNLYLTGEILDVDGKCGGYNLTFAWTTGILAGEDND